MVTSTNGLAPAPSLHSTKPDASSATLTNAKTQSADPTSATIPKQNCSNAGSDILSSPKPPSPKSSSPPTPSKQNLHGRAFYESIGSPKFVLAPMVDQSEFAWRMLTRSFMPQGKGKGNLVAYTPMLHARLFGEGPRFRENHFLPLRTSLVDSEAAGLDSASSANNAPYLDGNPALDRPLFTQFCANDPDELLAAAKFVAPFCDAVDLNLGCPQGIAKKGHYGAFLQEDQPLIYRMINKLHLELDVPVTAKIRILNTREETLNYAKMCLDAGASILTVHGRKREAKGHKTGLADWSVIRFLREELPKETVLFANGNILSRMDVDRCLEETGADGVMSAEGNLYDPSLFAEKHVSEKGDREYWEGNDGKGGFRMDAVLRRYMDIIYTHVLEVSPPARKPLYLPSDSLDDSVLVQKEKLENEGEDEEEDSPPKKKQKLVKKKRQSRTIKKETSKNPSHIGMQPHLFKLLRPLVAKHHHIRDALARCRAGGIEAFEAVLQAVEVAVAQGIKRYADTDGKSWDEEEAEDERVKEQKLAEAIKRIAEENAKMGVVAESGKGEMDESSLEMVRICRRPWWVVQPYVRPLPSEALKKGALSLGKKDFARLVEKGQGSDDVGKVGDGEKVEVAI
ncbi:hypothetical protein BJ878DRAFT_488877 [Calycina marina]|uniref:tRNA-dihydrouridine(16/17) synthase [NAD(P)(+)] n=1 Tax=Calycina marina TaxID=1763456 RepID=A0A9P7ZA33_9HELO|nr:hypothetical protein BJ878DRAFT_488877 [Calycina marina]